MAEVFALLRENAPMLFARKRGNSWHVDETMPDVGPRGRKLCVFVPGTDVLGLEAVIPARSEAEARKAAPYAIEDDIGEPVETVHVALGGKPAAPDAPRHVSVVSNTQLETWVQRLEDRGVHDASLVAAHSVLPTENTLVEAGELVLGRLGARSFTLERDVGADVFLGLSDNHQDVTIYGRELAAGLRQTAAGEGIVNTESLLAQLATWAQSRELIDLRQGAFRPRRRVDLQGFQQWRVLGGLAAAACFIWLVSVVLETRAMQSRASDLEQRAVQFTQAGWPEAGGDPRRALAMIGGPQTSDSGSVFPSALTAIAVLYDGIQSVDGSELRSVRYDRSRGQVAAVVAFDSFGGADALTQAMSSSGFSIRAGDARQSGDKVVGEITLEAGQ